VSGPVHGPTEPPRKGIRIGHSQTLDSQTINFFSPLKEFLTCSVILDFELLETGVEYATFACALRILASSHAGGAQLSVLFGCRRGGIWGREWLGIVLTILQCQ
jgi:hypothetical protein